MLKALTLPFKIIKWFFMLLFLAFGLFLVAILLYITNIMRDPVVLTQVGESLGGFFSSLGGVLNIQWMEDWATTLADTGQIAAMAHTADIVFGVTITVVALAGISFVAGIVLKILNRVRKTVV